MKIVSLLLVACLACFSVKAQNSTDVRQSLQFSEDTLEHLGNIMVYGDSVELRMRACYSFIPKLRRALANKGSFQYKFDRLTMISIQEAPDMRFRIITWQVMFDSERYRHFGVIQMNSSDGALEMF